MSYNTTDRSLAYYSRLGFYVPYGLFCCTVVLLVLGSWASILYCAFIKGETKRLSHVMYTITKIIINELDVIEDDGIRTYRLFGAILEVRALISLFCIALVSLASAFFIAWEVFFLDETNKCDDGYDCYNKNKTYIEDCTEFQDQDVSCFKFVYRYDLATGAVGGVITVASKSIGIYGTCLIPLLKYFKRHCNDCVKCYIYFLSFIPTITFIGGMAVLSGLYLGHQIITTGKDFAIYLIYLLLVISIEINMAYVIVSVVKYKESSVAKFNNKLPEFASAIHNNPDISAAGPLINQNEENRSKYDATPQTK